MLRWVHVSSSDQGKRKTNDDFVATKAYYFRRRRVVVLLACDGVGGQPGGDKCSAAIGYAALTIVEAYLRRRRSRRSLDKRDLQRLQRRLLNLPVRDLPAGSATTFTLVLFDCHRRREGYSLVAMWAGDTQAHFIDVAGNVIRLTRDHHDDEGRITAYFGSDGRVYGKFEGNVYISAVSPCAIGVTTDGIHEHCDPRESLYHFLLYCVDQRIMLPEQLSHELTEFLEYNISDNYSMAFLYRPLSARRLAVAESHLLEVSDANSQS